MSRRLPVPLPVLATVLSLALAGCSSSPEPKAADSTATAAAASPLAGDPWQWVATQTPVEWIVPDDPAKYTIQFGADGTATLRVDCNRGHGTYTTGEGAAIAIGPLAVTRMMCPTGSFDTQYLQQLDNVAHYFFRGDTLYIDQKMDAGTMRFVRGPASSE